MIRKGQTHLPPVDSYHFILLQIYKLNSLLTCKHKRKWNNWDFKMVMNDMLFP